MNHDKIQALLFSDDIDDNKLAFEAIKQLGYPDKDTILDNFIYNWLDRQSASFHKFTTDYSDVSILMSTHLFGTMLIISLSSYKGYYHKISMDNVLRVNKTTNEIDDIVKDASKIIKDFIKTKIYEL